MTLIGPQFLTWTRTRNPLEQCDGIPR
jgi:hypothetical protein